MNNLLLNFTDAILNWNGVGDVADAGTVVGMQTADSNQTLYTIPAGKIAMVFGILIHDPTDSLAGGTDFDFGDTGAANYFKSTVDLSGVTDSPDGVYLVTADDAALVRFVAGDVIEIDPQTGSTADADATVAVLGLLLDAP